jgi:hypothetical protein
LDGDRVTSLMVQAAARGLIDFSEADLLDRRWWTKLWWLLDRIQADNVITIRQMEHAQDIAMLDYTLPEKAFDLHWDRAVSELRDVWDALFPWCKMEDITNKASDQLYRSWVNKWGDLNDPETLKKVKLTVDYLKQLRTNAYNKRKGSHKVHRGPRRKLR